MTLFERATELSEVGAGIQLGPNVTRLLNGWGLERDLKEVAAFPPHLQVRDAISGRELGVLRLGDTARQRYGAPYATVHRADLHCLLLGAVQQRTRAELRVGCSLTGFTETSRGVTAQAAGRVAVEGDVLLGADGLWSSVRAHLLHDGPPRVTGHLAYRALVPQTALPASRRSLHVTVWLGPDLHLVQYPVRGGEWLNVVGIVHTDLAAATDSADGAGDDPENWDQLTTATRLRAALAGTCPPLQDLVHAIPAWRRWVLHDRAPMSGPHQMVRGRVALLGDAAHPMRPYLAQGAGMALEDAAELGVLLAQEGVDVHQALRTYAERRWQRNARVQARALRNGRIFHARGLVRIGRDAALKVFGERLLDLPWLYRY